MKRRLGICRTPVARLAGRKVVRVERIAGKIEALSRKSVLKVGRKVGKGIRDFVKTKEIKDLKLLLPGPINLDFFNLGRRHVRFRIVPP